MIPLISLLASVASADPCGMVPPMRLPDHIVADVAIERTGLQQTWSFYRDGVQDIAIRPGFKGTVDEFGMLVPLPAAPALRKIPDATFDHLEATVDPPEVRVREMELERMTVSRSWRMKKSEARSSAAPMELRKDEVRVVKEEAVGMYEVAVLEAGSAKALDRWMESHDYQYPAGMDDTVEDYVASGWVFVAVKARVGQKSGSDPRPGMREVDFDKPAGASFDGFVQGMGFRFEVDEPVIPMRLSTFNGSDTHNTVYMLHEDAVRIDGLDPELVVRQVPGETVLENLTAPLPLQMDDGLKYSRLHEHYQQQIEAQRNPAPYNGVAREVIVGDLLAATTGTLALAHEESEKELLRLSELLGLRGPSVDRLHADAVAVEREAASEDALEHLVGMTLTVIDGDFPRDFLRDHNLTFSPYDMPDARNDPSSWTRRPIGPEVWVYN